MSAWEEVLGEYLHLERRRLGLTQTELAHQLTGLGMKIHGTGITRLEQGNRGVSLNEFFIIAQWLEIDQDRLLKHLDHIKKFRDHNTTQKF